MADFTQQDGKWVRNRAVTKAQIEGAEKTAKTLLTRWQDDFDTMNATQRWTLVKRTTILLLRAVIYLVRTQLQD